MSHSSLTKKPKKPIEAKPIVIKEQVDLTPLTTKITELELRILDLENRPPISEEEQQIIDLLLAKLGKK